VIRAFVIVVALAAPVAAEPSYARPSRIEHLQAALDALAALAPAGRQALELELHTAVRTRCPTARITCMIEVARGICAGRPACLAASDVILTNEHAEPALVDDATRMRQVRASADYHAAVGAVLWSRYALLAVELALAAPGASLAMQIDELCALRDRTVHSCEPGAKACVPSLAYQRCAAGLVWFVAGHDEAIR
jgi:hypothetical protein